jgi:DNA-directed RNA polymerase sigma subunit (sigma70/sigma32)
MKECCKVCVKKEVSCPVEDCEHWIDFEKDNNCALIAIDNHGRMTLRECADRMKVSFVRIKQIEDKALKKLTESSLSTKSYLFYGRD